MIDLHLHLDGSLSEEDFKYLSSKQALSLGKNFPNNIYVPMNCSSLEEYLERFDLPVKLMQDKDSLKYVIKSLVQRLHKLGYIYAEIRFAPLLHLNKGLTQYEVVEAVVEGLKEGLAKYTNFDANLILCCMRHADEETNIETIEVANKFKGNKVVAVDLAGGEAIHNGVYFKNVFALAKKYKLNITIHAGEATGSEEIMMAIDNGASRIGHGVHLSLDEKSIKKVKDNNVCFEFCPTSNLQTKSLKTYKDVPLLQFLNLQIPTTINSDNMTCSNTTAIKEMEKMEETFFLSKSQIYTLLSNSCNYAFLNKDEKNKLLKLLDEKFDDFYDKIKIKNI